MNMTSRTFAAGRFEFVIEASDVDLLDPISEVFGDLPSGSGSSPAVAQVVRSPLGIEIDAFGAGWRSFTSIGNAAWMLVQAINRRALDASPEQLHLHAAALECNGRSVVLLGQRRSGKSTLCAHLVTSGWAYLTDEMVGLDTGSESIEGYMKPMSLRGGTRSLVRGFDSVGLPTTNEGRGALVRAGEVGRISIDPTTPRLIVLLRGRADQRADNTPALVHPIEAATEIMSDHVLDASRFGIDAIAAVGRFCARAPVLAMTACDLDDMTREIERHFDRPIEAPVVGWARVPENMRIPGLSHGLHMLTIAGASILVDGHGRFLPLGPDATEIWLGIVEGRPLDSESATLLETIRDRLERPHG